MHICHSTEYLPQPELRQPNQEGPDGAPPSSPPPSAPPLRRLREDITDTPALIPPTRCCLLIARSRLGGHRQEGPWRGTLEENPGRGTSRRKMGTTSSMLKQPRCLRLTRANPSHVFLASATACFALDDEKDGRNPCLSVAYARYPKEQGPRQSLNLVP